MTINHVERSTKLRLALTEMMEALGIEPSPTNFAIMLEATYDCLAFGNVLTNVDRDLLAISAKRDATQIRRENDIMPIPHKEN